MASTRPRLTEGPVGGHLVSMALPVLFGIATMMAQAFIDAWFLGRVGDRALAAHAFAFPVLMIVVSVSIGLSAGTSSVVARALGGDDHRRARRLSTDSLILSLLVTAIVTAIGVLTINPLFGLMGAPGDLMAPIRGFMSILYISVPFVIVGMVGAASMRATGDTRLPSLLMIGGALLNVALDPLFIFGWGPVPALGLNGAAIAALLSRAAICLLTVHLLHRRLDLVSFARPRGDELRQSWRDIMQVAVPAAGTNVIVPAATAIITAIVARYGADAVAGFGVASRIESLVLVLYYTLSAVIGPFVGQNLAAGKEDRILHALRLCAVFCVGTGLVIAAFLALAAGFLPRLFSDSPSVVGVTRLFLLIAPIGYGAYGVVMVMNASFNGIGRPLPGVVVSAARTIGLYVPIALAARYWLGLPGVFAAYALANLIAGAWSYAWARRTVMRESERRIQAAAPAMPGAAREGAA